MINRAYIMSVEDREREGAAVEALVRLAVEHAKLDIEVFRMVDRNRALGVWGNFKRCLEHDVQPDEHMRLVFQDDVSFSRTCLAKMNHVSKFVPEGSPLGFYNPANRGYVEAAEKGYRILTTHTNLWLQATAFPTHAMSDAIRWLEKRVSPEYGSADRRLCMWMKDTGVMAYAHLPGLVQHLGAFRSTLGYPGKVGKYERVSRNWEPDCDVQGVDWGEEFAYPYRNEVQCRIEPRWLLST